MQNLVAVFSYRVSVCSKSQNPAPWDVDVGWHSLTLVKRSDAIQVTMSNHAHDGGR